ncbi:MAG: DnaD domain protein [Clostridia bacterium]|nr:DnaD domain protein [Clostridia bacterium]
MIFTVKEGFSGNIIIPESFIRNDMRLLNGEEIRVCLYIFMLCQNKTETDMDVIASKTAVDTAGVFDAVNKLEEIGIIKVSKNKITLLPAAGPDCGNLCAVGFSVDDLNTVDDEAFKSICASAEQAYGKALNEGMVNSLLSIYNWTGLPAEVINLLMFYLAQKGKKSMNYLEKTAVDWKEREIDTVEKANEYIRTSELRDEKCEHIKILLGIYGRNLVKKEREFILKWIEKFTDEEILAAYETAVEKTGKISFSYTDRILNDDGEVNEIKTKVKKTKFVNFQQDKSDFDDIREKSLKQLLGKNYGKSEK